MLKAAAIWPGAPTAASILYPHRGCRDFDCWSKKQRKRLVDGAISVTWFPCRPVAQCSGPETGPFSILYLCPPIIESEQTGEKLPLVPSLTIQ